MNDKIRAIFTPEHHALLFGWLAREVIQRFGKQNGEEALRKAIRRYGEQRGRRMALRAQANGHELSMLNYIAYIEWKAGKGEMDIKILHKNPHLRANILKCPWVTVWEKNDLTRYTRCYCPEADESIVSGFNPKLKISISQNRANGAPNCDMVFHDANLNLKNAIIMKIRKMRLQKYLMMPWDYHTGHLYKTMGEIIVSEFGSEGKDILQAVLTEFAHCYGESAAQIVAAYQKTDFNRLP